MCLQDAGCQLLTCFIAVHVVWQRLQVLAAPIAAGSYINKLLPAWISHLLLALLLTLMTVRVLQRAFMIYKKETAAQQQPCTDDLRQEMLAESVPTTVATPEAFMTPHAADVKDLSSCSSPSRASPIGAIGAVQLVEVHKNVSPGKASPVPIAPGPAAASSSTGMSKDSTRCSSSTTNPAGSMPRAGSSKLGANLQTSPARQQKLHDQQLQPVGLRHRQQQEQHRGSSQACVSQDGLMPGDVECRLAYAPPGHTRRSSWELQDGWDDAWEAHSFEDDSSQSQPAAAQTQLGVARMLGAGSELATVGEKALLNSGRASSAPVVGTSISRSSAPTATSPGAGAAVGSGAELEHHSHADWARNYGSLAPSSAAAAVATDACAVVHKTATAESCSTGSSFSSQRAKAQQQPPELSAHSPELQALLTAEAAQLPVVPLLLLVVLFLAVMLTSLFSKSCKCGSVAFWLVQWTVSPVLLAVWWYSRGRVLKKVALKRVAGLDFHGEQHNDE